MPNSPSADLAPEIWVLLARVRTGLRRKEASRALAIALAIALAGLWLLIVTDWALQLPEGARRFALGGIILAAASVFMWRLAHTISGGLGPLYLASRIEALHPNFQNRLISAVEIMLSGRDIPLQSSERLVLKQASELTRSVNVSEVIAHELERSGAHKWLLGSLGALALLALAMGGAFPVHTARCLFPGLGELSEEPALLRVEPGDILLKEGEQLSVRALFSGEPPEDVTLELATGDAQRSIPMRRNLGGRFWSSPQVLPEGPGTYRVRATSSGRQLLSPDYRLRILAVPAAKKIVATYIYPPYTSLPPRTQEGGGLDGLLGTRVRLELVPSVPISSAELVTSEGERIALSGSENLWTGELIISRTGSYHIEMMGLESVRGSTQEFSIVARPDLPPKCDAVAPEELPEEATATGASFRLHASDDIGLKEFVLVVKHEGSEKVVNIPVPGFSPAAREFRTDVTIPPQVLPLEPGSSYRYYVRASDARPPDGQISRSDERTFRVRKAGDQGPLLSRRTARKKRPPLLEPPDGQADPPPPSGGTGTSSRPSRGLEGLSDGTGSGGPPQTSGGEAQKKSSPYASGPGLEEPAGPRGGSRPQLPGQGAPSGTGTSSGGSRAQSSGTSQQGQQGDAEPSKGHGGSQRFSDSTGQGGPGGGGTQRQERKVERDGGIPTGRETGVGEPMPETVDESAVAALNTVLGERGEPLPPPELRGASRIRSSGANGRDLSTGLARQTMELSGRERISIPKDALGDFLSSPKGGPISKTYRALVVEYLRRLEELGR